MMKMILLNSLFFLLIICGNQNRHQILGHCDGEVLDQPTESIERSRRLSNKGKKKKGNKRNIKGKEHLKKIRKRKFKECSI